MSSIIELNNENIDTEHICCAISDKKCQEGYELKKGGSKMSLIMVLSLND